MSQGLWVEHKTDIETCIAWIPIKKYQFIGQIIREVKKDTQLAIPKNAKITLHGSSGTPIEVDEPISSLLPGNSSKAPLRIQVTDPSKPASYAELNDFWNSLRNIRDEEGFLRFPVRPEFFPSEFGTLYIRRAYEDLFNIICENRDPENPEQLTGMAISGTPGIGKSVFLFYILWRLANMELAKTVVLRRRGDEGCIYVFRNDGCWITMNRKDIRLLLKDPTTWYLADALLSPPGNLDAVTIVVSSPAEKYYSEFLKWSHVAPLHYLPVWSLDELRLVAPFYRRELEGVEERFNMIGGLPRYVLEKKVDLVKLISQSINKLALDKLLLIALGKISKEDQISHRVVHFKVEPPFYTDCTLTMASVYALNEASKKFLSHSEREVKYFLYCTAGMLSLAFFRAKVFEGYAHQKLSEGGNFPMRCLEDKTEGILMLPKRNTAEFHDISNCKDSGVYYIPVNPDFPCIDSVIPGVGYFQMTTSLDHKIVKRKMSEIVRVMHMRRFYFVVPHMSFERFRKQKFSKEKEPEGTVTNQVSDQMVTTTNQVSDQVETITNQLSETEIFEDIENLEENLMDGSRMNDTIWNPRKDLIEQYVISISIDVGLDFKDLERMINSRETQQSEVRGEISTSVD